ncbi:SMI1/KNR4 family protein [Vibrio brasiliensis]
MSDQKSLEKLSEEELKEKYNLFLFHLSELLHNLVVDFSQKNIDLDYSLESLNKVEKYLIEEKIDKDEDVCYDLSCYLGEVVKRNYEGKWKLSLDKNNDELNYGLPVIYGHSKYNIEFSPFRVFNMFIKKNNRSEGYFIARIENHINPVNLDLSDLPTEIDPNNNSVKKKKPYYGNLANKIRFDKVKKVIKGLKSNLIIHGGVSSEDINHLEKEIGLSLSHSYKWFLTEFGALDIFGEEKILGISKDDSFSSLQKTIEYWEKGLPRYCIVIQDCDEWIYCLNTNKLKKDEMSIVSWDLEEGLSGELWSDFGKFLMETLIEAEMTYKK